VTGNKSLTIVVGTGYVGQRFLARVDADAAIGLNRSPVSGTHVIHSYDLDAGGALPINLPDRYQVLYTVAPPASSEADVRLERLLAELSPTPEIFVYISTTGVYGNCDGALVDEQRDVQPATMRARRRVAAEQALQEWSTAEAVRLCILRTPGIYGPRRLGVERIRDGLPVIREADANPGNRIHVDDIVACCIAALSADKTIGICNIGDGDMRSSTWFAGEVARQSGLPPPPEISRQQAEQQFTPRRLSFLSESRRIDTSRMRDVLGVTPRYANAEDGIRASLAEQDANPS